MDASLNLVFSRIIATAAKRRASDIHFNAGSRPVLRVDDDLIEISEEDIITTDFIEDFVGSVIDDAHKKELEEHKHTSFVTLYENKIRVRVNAYRQKGTLAVSLKLIPVKVPSLSDIRLPKSVSKFANTPFGLIVISGPYGSGRTTTAAALLQEINRTQARNIMTIEKPVEYVFVNQKSIIEQREVGRDANSFTEAMEFSRQEDVDVLYVGENDEEGVVPMLVDFAAGGRLVITVQDSLTAIQAIEHLISSFPKDEEARARTILSDTLRGVIAQRLLPQVGGGKIVAAEVLVSNSAIASILDGGNLHQLENILQTSHEEGMVSMDQSLAYLVKAGEVQLDVAKSEAEDKQHFQTMIQ